ncbi:hypothetical protein PIB30_091260 [Stylosanthes scabra]|uniref:Uncharacterized protein n=1 Tax=Stylosanthes scabra TaxID=79078 RepID=A0ABU6QV48_9FABA|nr:hypothetical protein [Stylosanthes scabra]
MCVRTISITSRVSTLPKWCVRTFPLVRMHHPKILGQRTRNRVVHMHPCLISKCAYAPSGLKPTKCVLKHAATSSIPHSQTLFLSSTNPNTHLTALLSSLFIIIIIISKWQAKGKHQQEHHPLDPVWTKDSESEGKSKEENPERKLINTFRKMIGLRELDSDDSSLGFPSSTSSSSEEDDIFGNDPGFWDYDDLDDWGTAEPAASSEANCTSHPPPNH